MTTRHIKVGVDRFDAVFSVGGASAVFPDRMLAVIDAGCASLRLCVSPDEADKLAAMFAAAAAEMRASLAARAASEAGCINTAAAAPAALAEHFAGQEFQ